MPHGNKLTKANYPEFSRKKYKLAFLNLFNTTNSLDKDPINTKVWGIINSKQRKDIEESFSGKITHTRQETKEDILKIIKLRDSLNGRKNLYVSSVESLIKTQSLQLGLGLEFFLWDAIERNNKNPDLSFEKPGQHLDQLYCSDLILTYPGENSGKTKIGIDFTIANDKEIRAKKLGKIKRINKELKKNGIKDYSVKRTPQSTGIVFIDKDQLKLGKNEFTKALNLFYSTEDPTGGPFRYLSQGQQNKINNLANILITVFEKISKNDFSNFKIRNNNIGEYHISFQRNLNRLIVRAGIAQNLLFEFIVDLPEVDEDSKKALS